MTELPIIFKPNLFTSDKLKKEGSNIIIHKRFLWFFKLKHLSETRSFNMSKLEYVAFRNTKLLKRPYLLVGVDDTTYRVYLKKDEAEKLFEEIKNNEPEFLTQNVKILTKKGEHKANTLLVQNEASLWLYNDRLVHIRDKSDSMASDEGEAAALAPEHVEFFTRRSKRSWLTLWLRPVRSLYVGGRTKQYHISSQSSDALLPQMREHLVAKGCKIALIDEGGEEISDAFWFWKLFKPKHWREHATIRLHDEGIGYQWRKGAKRDERFIPYKDITFCNFPKGWKAKIFNKPFQLYGIQNIDSNLKYSPSARAKVKKAFDKYNTKSAQIIKPRHGILTLFMRHLFPDTKIFLGEDDKFIAYISKHEESKYFNNVTDIAWKKKHFYNIRGKLAYTGLSSTMRDDEYGKYIVLKIEKIAFWEKNAIKDKFPEAKYNGRDFRKEIGFK